MAEGAPLLREYVGKTCIKGSNPFDSARELLKDRRCKSGVCRATVVGRIRRPIFFFRTLSRPGCHPMPFHAFTRTATGLGALCVMLVLGGCGALGRIGSDADHAADERISHTGDAQLDKLNQGYSLLYESASGLRLADKILLVKFESGRTHQVVTAISGSGFKSIRTLG